MAQMTLTVPVKKMRHFQDLVKFYNLRFCGRPLLAGDGYRVVVATDDMSAYNRFSETWDRITTAYVPPKKSMWQRFIGMFK